MKKSSKLLLSFGALAFSAILLSSCTASFCSNTEKARMLAINEPGVTNYYNLGDTYTIGDATYTIEPGDKVDGFDNLYSVSKFDFSIASKINSLNASALNNGFTVPHIDYFAAFDKEVFLQAYDLYAANNTITKSDVNAEKAKEIIKEYGYVKFFAGADAKEKVWDNWNVINNKVIFEVGVEKSPSRDYTSFYISQMKASITNSKSCITTVEGEFGAYGNSKDPITMEAKSWGYAWKKGFIEGLLVYPVAWLVDVFAHGLNYNSIGANGVPQLLSILFVTLIVRGLLVAVSLKSTIGQQKMTQLQPELAKIQAKYPNSDTNQAQKQRLAQEQMALYKKHKINPMSSLLIMIVQFPVFIAVWSAMTGSAVLSTGQFLGLRLSDSIGTVLMSYIAKGGFTANAGGWWTALVLFVLMAVSQFLSMQLPQWIQKAKNKNATKLGKNPAQDKNNKTMKIMSTVMTIMIIFMGFSLPSAMGFYWFVGALISMAQTGIIQGIMSSKGKKHHKKGAK